MKPCMPGWSVRRHGTLRGPPISGGLARSLTRSEWLKRADDVSLRVAVEWAAVARASGRNSAAP